jgi:hypothetical protein
MKEGLLFGGLSPPNKTTTPLRLCGKNLILDKSDKIARTGKAAKRRPREKREAQINCWRLS